MRSNTTKQKPMLELSPLKKAMLALGADQDVASNKESSGSKYQNRMSGMRKRITSSALGDVKEENKS